MKQPKALQIAVYLDDCNRLDLTIPEAAAELRRLHEANQAMLEALKGAEQSLGSFVSDHGWSQEDMSNFDAVTAAIAKGEQQ